MESLRKRKKGWVLGALAILVAGLLATTGMVSAAKVTAEDLASITEASAVPGLLGEDYLAHGRGWGPRGDDIDYAALLARELGITVDELEAAYEEARAAAIEAAVEEGLLTREQADRMLVWGGPLGKFGLRGGFGGRMSSGPIDEEALLANALGISVEELQAAREAANQAAVDQAVEEGFITEEEAAEMQARKALQSYLDRDALLAEALGMSVDELQAAYADGETLSSLMESLGLDAVTVRENLLDAHEVALDRAVADGVITAEEADELRDTPMLGRGMGTGFGGSRGPDRRFGDCGPRGFRGPDTEGTTDTSFPMRRLQRFPQGEDAL
ncbi:MAG: hypothetical protein ACP5HG_13130 [Anaerolineae bacterium]